MSSFVVHDGRKFTGVQLITLHDGVAGFCALMTYALNGVRCALAHDRLAVVRFDGSPAPCCFYDPTHGENVWEYYFEPVMGVSSDALRTDYHTADVHEQSEKEVFWVHQRDPERLATFWAWKVPVDPAEWMRCKRQLGRDFVSRFIRVKPHIRAKVDAYAAAHFTAPYMIGAHVRGTDFGYAQPTTVEKYFEAIDAHVREQGRDDFGVFLATDQKQFVDQFRERYENRLVHYECLRSDTDVAPFQLPVESPYALGEEMLIDILLMAKCDHLIKGAAAAGEYALWFAPNLSCTDFALQSHFIPRPTHLLKPAFRKLNVDGRGRFHGTIPSILRLNWLRLLVYKVRQLRPRLMTPHPNQPEFVPTGLAALVWKVSPRRYLSRLYHRGVWRRHRKPQSIREHWSMISHEVWFDTNLAFRATRRWIFKVLRPSTRVKIRKVMQAKEAKARIGVQYKERPNGTIVIHSFNQVQNVELLSSRVRLTSAEELIVCEDGSVDGSTETWLERLTGPNDFLLRSNDLHEIRVLDRAIHFARGDVVCVMQDDDKPPKDGAWFDDALDLFTRYPDMAVLGGWLGFTGFEREWWNSSKADDEGTIAFQEPETGQPFMFVEHVNIGPYFIRRSAYDVIGGFDFRYSPVGVCGIYFDSEFCYRAWLKGFRVGLVDIPVGKNADLGGTHLWGRPERLSQGTRNQKLLVDTYRADQPAINEMVNRANEELLARKTTATLRRRI